MKKFSNKAFTLIELLVVITIIGILATGAVAVYTSQIQKGRDATRITSINALKGGIEQFYQDGSSYPSTGTGFKGVKTYVPVLPKDPKTGQSSTYTSFDYSYNVGPDSNGIQNQVYEVSAGLENSGNVTAKANNTEDGGNDDYRLEIGIIGTGTEIIETGLKGDQTTVTSWITGDPTDNTCVGASGNTAETCGSDPDSPMVIR